MNYFQRDSEIMKRAVAAAMTTNKAIPSKSGTSNWFFENMCGDAQINPQTTEGTTIDRYSRLHLQKTASNFFVAEGASEDGSNKASNFKQPPGVSGDAFASRIEDAAQNLRTNTNEILKPISSATGSTLGTNVLMTKDATGSLQANSNSLCALTDSVNPAFTQRLDATLKKYKVDGLMHMPGKLMGSIQHLANSASKLLSVPLEFMSDIYRGIMKLFKSIAKAANSLFAMVTKFFIGPGGLMDGIMGSGLVKGFLGIIKQIGAKAMDLVKSFGGTQLIGNLTSQLGSISSLGSKFLSNPMALAQTFLPNSNMFSGGLGGAIGGLLGGGGGGLGGMLGSLGGGGGLGSVLGSLGGGGSIGNILGNLGGGGGLGGAISGLAGSLGGTGGLGGGLGGGISNAISSAISGYGGGKAFGGGGLTGALSGLAGSLGGAGGLGSALGNIGGKGGLGGGISNAISSAISGYGGGKAFGGGGLGGAISGLAGSLGGAGGLGSALGNIGGANGLGGGLGKMIGSLGGGAGGLSGGLGKMLGSLGGGFGGISSGIGSLSQGGIGSKIGSLAGNLFPLKDPSKIFASLIPGQLGSQISKIASAPGLGFQGNQGYSVGNSFEKPKQLTQQLALSQLGEQVGILGPLLGLGSSKPNLTNKATTGPLESVPSSINSGMIASREFVQETDTTARKIFSQIKSNDSNSLLQRFVTA